MENLNTSVTSQESSVANTGTISRVARKLVCHQLSMLGHGKLVVREQGYDDQVFGDNDERYPTAELIIHNHSAGPGYRWQRGCRGILRGWGLEFTGPDRPVALLHP